MGKNIAKAIRKKGKIDSAKRKQKFIVGVEKDHGMDIRAAERGTRVQFLRMCEARMNH